MGDQELERWLYARRSRQPLAKTFPMLDGFVAAVVAGPSMDDPPAWIGPLLAVEPSAFDTGGTPEFAAIKTVADRFNAIGADLQGAGLKPRHRRKANGDIDASDWCEGFMAAVNLRRAAWGDLLNPDNRLNGLMLPIMLHCKDSLGRPLLGPPRPGQETQIFLKQAYADIPMCVAAIREHYHVIWYDDPRHASRRR